MSINTEQSSVSVSKNEEVLSVLKIFLFLVVMAIPIVNLIMSFRWSFKRNINLNLRNLSRVFFIIYIVTFAMYVFVILAQ